MPKKSPVVKILLPVMILLSTLSCLDADHRSREKAQQVYKEYELIVETAARHQRVNLDRFSEASVFFEKLTGIIVPGDHNFVADWYPTQQTATAVKPLRQWYAANKDRLYWDEATNTVKLRPPS